MAAENTAKKQQIGVPFKPGQSGNPLGRPKGSRNKLSEAFIEAMCDDFQEHGVDVIEKVRTDKPDQYLKVIASILPKEFHVKDVTFDDMSDDELSDILTAVRALKAGPVRAKASTRGVAPAGNPTAGKQLN